MNYFNFFENAQSQKNQSNLPLIVAFLLLAALVILGGDYLIARTRLNRAKADLAYLEKVESDPSFVAQYEQVRKLDKSITQTEKNYMFLLTSDWIITDGTTVSDELVREIMACFGKKGKLIKLRISGTEVILEGVADSLATLIDIEQSFSASPSFRSVFVNSAKEDSHLQENGDEAVEFNCKLILSKEVKQP